MTTTPQRANAFTHVTAKLSTLSNPKKAMLACGIAAGVVAAIVLAVSGVSAAATTRAQNDALRGAQTALSDLTTAQQTTSKYASTIGEALMAANSLVGDADNLVSISDGILDATGRAAVAAASTTLKTTAQAAASSRSIDLTSGVSTSPVAKTTSPTVDETMSTAELHNTAEDLAKLASTETKAVKEGAALLEALAVQSDAVTEPLAGTSANAIDNTDQFLAALTAAAQPERDAIGNAATLLRTTLTEGGSLMKPLTDYATAARAGPTQTPQAWQPQLRAPGVSPQSRPVRRTTVMARTRPPTMTRRATPPTTPAAPAPRPGTPAITRAQLPLPLPLPLRFPLRSRRSTTTCTSRPTATTSAARTASLSAPTPPAPAARRRPATGSRGATRSAA